MDSMSFFAVKWFFWHPKKNTNQLQVTAAVRARALARLNPFLDVVFKEMWDINTDNIEQI